MNILLDTCAVIWAISDPSSLSKRGRRLLEASESKIHVSPISAAEIACAVERGRIQLDWHWRKWFRYYVELNDWQIVDIDLDIIEEAYSLPDAFHADPADRILAATSRTKSLIFLTADKKILSYPHVKSVW